MSFASTPLGQGRRLDHHTFLRKTSSTSAAVTASSSTQIHATNASQRPRSQRAALSNGPVSYSYGAPTTSVPRSPPKPEGSKLTTQETEEQQPNEAEQPALVRFARLKQQEQAQQQQNQPHVGGPRVINTPPNPTRWAVKDTSVNIASAFHQAASSIVPAYDTSTSSFGSNNSTIMNPNDSWASNTQRKSALPRSTSVEYEKEQQAMARRLGNPAPRSNVSRPSSRIARQSSARSIPESPVDADAENASNKGKTPFEQVIDMSKKLTSIAPTTFFLRRQSVEPETRQVVAPQDQSTSYDYSAEEREFQQESSLQDASNSMEQRRKRNHRISEDNKAYKPNLSDFEESDEEFEENGKRTRRKKGKKGAIAGTLTSLPVVGYDKRKKGRRGTKENGVAEDGESDDEVQEISRAAVAAERAAKAPTPVIRPPSLPRPSVPSSSRLSVPRSSVPPEPQYTSEMNGDAGMETGLHSIPEIDESFNETDTSAEVLSQRSFSVGATLGRGVHWIFSMFSALAWAIWGCVIYVPMLILRTIALLIDSWVLSPLRNLGRRSLSPLYRLVPWVFAGLAIYFAVIILKGGYLSGLIPSSSSSLPTYSPPSTGIPADLAELTDRLLRAESALSALSIDNARTRTYSEGNVRELALLANKLSAIESRIAEESSSTIALESKLQSSMHQAVQTVKQEVAVLHAQLDSQEREAKRQGNVANDKEARALLEVLERRVKSVEGEAKEAIELSRSTKNVGPIGELPAWVKDLAAGKTAVTIKSTDGKDVSTLIDKLVESAVTKASRDGIGRPDYAMYSSGGSIIPSLTSQTYEIKPDGLTNRVIGMFTGQGNVIGRPPVTILHHENHDGHCWPFPGSQGQVGVMLAMPTRITDITIDHISKDMGTNLRSAPRHMEVWGLVEGEDNLAKYKAWTEQREASRALAQERGEEFEELEFPSSLSRGSPFMRIAKFAYNVHANKEIQTFPVSKDVKDLDMDFGIVVLVVKSNWGREELTCLYRFRVHGEPLGGIPEPLPEDSI
ncbi:hypothetical protein BDY19DRAFT_935069 [Irpex rosettiformis]|uniref:Uncharacterized protein n=1 Tax=Irpex rosettiformis TaxID=378272 RepID=A0ACB8UAN7_9APHY|nr:hypothetical protein BDY19DRAFT_935069 [Irpex rosettiformis]